MRFRSKLSGFLIYSLPIVFLVSNWIYIYNFGVDIPYWDQWDAEADLYIKYLKNELTIGYFIQPHNEHRIGITRLFSLVVFIINGGWSPKVTMYAQAILPALSLLSLLLLGKKLIPGLTMFNIFAISIFCLFVIPNDSENRLWGFQNQFFFMVSLVCASFYFLSRSDDRRPYIVIGLAMLLLPFTMASNLLFYFSILPLLAYRFFFAKSSKNKWLFLFGLGLIIVYSQWIFLVHLDGSENYRAKSIDSLLIGFFRALTHENYWMVLIVLVLPVLIVAQSVISIKHHRFQYLLIGGLLAFCYAQFLAISFSRNGLELSSRYQSLYVIVLIASLLVFAIRLSNVRKLMTVQIFFVMASIQVFFFLHLYIKNYHPHTIGVYQLQLKAYEQFTQVGERDLLSLDSGVFRSIHPDEARVKECLRDDYLKNYHIWLKQK